MNNPMQNERFNKLFHIANNLVLLVKKMDCEGTQKGYIENIQSEIDTLFIENLKKEKEK